MFSNFFIYLLLAAFAFAAAPPELEKQVLWQREQGGYAIYRIPGIVVTKAGTVLAYAEARKDERGDWGETDVVLKRSTDGGRTWSAVKVIGKMPGPFGKNPAAVAKKLGTQSGVLYNNPVAIADRSGAVHFLFCVEYMRAFYMRSDDDGQTFTEPVEITSAFEAFRPEIAWLVLATGPGHGIQLRGGRLVVPVWLALGTGKGAHGSSVAATVYSDDHGKTWHAGEVAARNIPEYASPNETAAVELSDGRVMLNVRTGHESLRRLLVYSKDGATHWSRPEYHDELFDPVCFASMARLSSKGKRGSRERLLFVNPDSGSRERKNLTVRLSYDEGRTWPLKRVIEPGPAGYSDLAVLQDGTILCLYEAGTPPEQRPAGAAGFRSENLTLARFGLRWLTEGKDDLRTKGRSAQ